MRIVPHTFVKNGLVCIKVKRLFILESHTQIWLQLFMNFFYPHNKYSSMMAISYFYSILPVLAVIGRFSAVNSQIIGDGSGPSTVGLDIIPASPVTENQRVTLLCSFARQRRAAGDPSAAALVGQPTALDYGVNIYFKPKYRQPLFSLAQYTAGIFVDATTNRAEPLPTTGENAFPWPVQISTDLTTHELRLSFLAEPRQEGTYACRVEQAIGIGMNSNERNLTVLAPLTPNKVWTAAGQQQHLSKAETIGPDPKRYFREDTPASSGVTERELSIRFRCAVHGVKPRPKIQFLLTPDTAASGGASTPPERLDEFVLQPSASPGSVYAVENSDGTWNVSSVIERELKRQDNNKLLGCVVYSKSSPQAPEYDVKVERLHKLKIPLEPHLEMRLVVNQNDSNGEVAGGVVSLDKSLQENGTYTYECRATNALPEADIKWTLLGGTQHNRDMSRLLTDTLGRISGTSAEQQRISPNPDDPTTFDTVSQVVLRNVPRYFNTALLICRAENVATRTLRINPPGFLQQTMPLSVTFAPGEPLIRAFTMIARTNSEQSRPIKVEPVPPSSLTNPSTMLASGQIAVDAGLSVRLTCDALSNPTATYSWTHDTEPITTTGTDNVDPQRFTTAMPNADDGADPIVINQKQLDLNNVQYDDAGVYACTARNQYGVREARVQVVVRHRPVCHRCALNSVNVIHHHQTNNMQHDVARRALNESNDLQQQQQVRVHEEQQSNNNIIGCPVGVNADQSNVEQHMRTLDCGSAVEAEPAAGRFSWYYLPDIDVRNTSLEQVMAAYEHVRTTTRELSSGPKYNATPAVANDVNTNGGSGAGYGMYLCLPENSLGIADFPCAFSVVPAARPRPPESCSMTKIGEKEVKIRCQPGWDGGYDQTFRIFVASPPESDIGPFERRQTNLTPNDEWTITNLPHAGSDYILTVQALNKLGESEPLQMAIRTAGVSPTQNRVKYTVIIIVGVAAVVVLLITCALVTILCKRNQSRRHNNNNNGRRGVANINVIASNGHYASDSSDSASHPQTASSGRSSAESSTNNNNTQGATNGAGVIARNGKSSNGLPTTVINGTKLAGNSDNAQQNSSSGAEYQNRVDLAGPESSKTTVVTAVSAATTTTQIPTYHYISASDGGSSKTGGSGISLHVNNNNGSAAEQKLGALKLARGQKQQQQHQKVKAPTAPAHYSNSDASTAATAALHYRAASGDLNNARINKSALSGSASSVPSSVSSSTSSSTSTAAVPAVVAVEKETVVRTVTSTSGQRTPSVAGSVSARPQSGQFVNGTTSKTPDVVAAIMNKGGGGVHSRQNSDASTADERRTSSSAVGRVAVAAVAVANSMMINSPKPMTKPFMNGNSKYVIATNANSVMNFAQHHMQQQPPQQYHKHSQHHLPSQSAAIMVVAANSNNGVLNRPRASGDVVAVV